MKITNDYYASFGKFFGIKVPIGTGPDELAYFIQAVHTARMGRYGQITFSHWYRTDRADASLPGPLRFFYIWVASLFVRVFGENLRALHILSMLSATACVWQAFALAFALDGRHSAMIGAVLVGNSPLLSSLGRRALQDTFVAALSFTALLACTAYAHGGSYFWPIFALAFLLGAKESALFFWPFFFGWIHTLRGRWLELDAVVAAGALICTFFAHRAATDSRIPETLRTLRVTRAAHATPYTRQFQSGMPHRLFVDIAITSPIVAFGVLAVAGHLPFAAAPVLSFVGLTLALMPLKNVRVVLFFELLLRLFFGMAISHLNAWRLYPLIALDTVTSIAIFHRLKSTYDPTTATLVTATGMVSNGDARDCRT